MEHSDDILLSLGYCVFMLLIALLFKKFPPKEINYFYGYRTRRAMANQKIWKAANSYATAAMVKVCLISFIFPLLFYFLYPTLNLPLTIGANTLLIISTMWFTEKHLDKSFDKNGNPK